MRTVFIPPSVEDFAVIFGERSLRGIRGGALTDIEIYKIPSRSIRGGGLFSFLSGMARRVIPFIGRAVKPAAIEFGKNVFTDLHEGNIPLKQSLKRRGIQAVSSTAHRVLRGEGRGKKKINNNKKRKTGSCIFKKKKIKKNYNDIFSSL